MIDMGNIDGSISGIDTASGGAFDSSNGGFGVDVGGSVNSSLDGGASIDLGNAGVAAYNSGQMAFTAGDAGALAGLAVSVAYALYGGNSPSTIAGIVGGMIASDASGSISHAAVDLAHDMALGLGIGVMANPSISMFATEMASIGATVGVGDDGSLAIMAGGGLFGIAGPNGTYDVMGYSSSNSYQPTPMDSGLGG